MLNLFKKKESTGVFQAPYRPSWEESARQWEQSHIALQSILDPWQCITT